MSDGYEPAASCAPSPPPVCSAPAPLLRNCSWGTSTPCYSRGFCIWAPGADCSLGTWAARCGGGTRRQKLRRRHRTRFADDGVVFDAGDDGLVAAQLGRGSDGPPRVVRLPRELRPEDRTRNGRHRVRRCVAIVGRAALDRLALGRVRHHRGVLGVGDRQQPDPQSLRGRPGPDHRDQRSGRRHRQPRHRPRPRCRVARCRKYFGMRGLGVDRVRDQLDLFRTGCDRSARPGPAFTSPSPRSSVPSSRFRCCGKCRRSGSSRPLRSWLWASVSI